MKKKIKFVGWLAVLFTTAFVCGCADGELPSLPQTPSPDLVPPQIIAFAANPATVIHGGATALTWEVAGATEVQVKSVNPNFVFDTKALKEMKGETKIEKLTETTEFVLTATLRVSADATAAMGTPATIVTKADDKKPAEAAKEQVLTATKSIKVTVETPQGPSLLLGADKRELSEGESTIIHWTVQIGDKDATPEQIDLVEVKDEEGDLKPLFAADVCKEAKDPEQLSQMAVSEKAPLSGCAIAGPGTYTITAKDKKGDSISGYIEIKLINIEVSASISVDGKKSLTVDSFEDAVTVTWNVTPESAKVAITSMPRADCTPPLPTGLIERPDSVPDPAPEKPDTTKAETDVGPIVVKIPVTESKCKISNDTTFEITAEYADKKVTETADVTRRKDMAVKMDINAESGWGFVGDKLKLTVTPKEGVIDKLLIQDKIGLSEQKFVAINKPIEFEVVVPEEGVYLKAVSAGKEVSEDMVVGALRLNNRVSTKDELGVTKVYFDNTAEKTLYTGVQLKYVGEDKQLNNNKGKLRLYKGGNQISIDFFEIFKKEGISKSNLLSLEGLHATFGEFPLSAVTARDGNPKQVFAATNGLIFASNDGGESWKLLVILANTTRGENDERYKNYDRTFPACLGRKRAGAVMEKNGDKPSPGQILGLSETCDMVATKSGLFIAATDKGIWMASNIDELIKATTEKRLAMWKAPLSNMVVNDLLCTDADCSTIYAATSSGVYVSKDGAQKWEQVGGNIGAVYAVEKSSAGLLAGTDKGVYAYTAGTASTSKAAAVEQTTSTGSSWVAVKGMDKKVFSLAIDSATSKKATVVAGTSDGVWVSHNAGSSFSPVKNTSTDGKTEVRSVAIATNTKMVGKQSYMMDYLVSVGAKEASMSGMVSITELMNSTTPAPKPDTTPAPTTPAPTTPSPTTPTTKPDPTTGK